MQRIKNLLAAGAIIMAPSLAMAAPPGGHPGGATPNMAHVPSPTTAPGQGQYNGSNYNHVNSPAHATGQPNQSCEEIGITPGNSASAPGGGSPFSGEDSTSGTHYAGSQLQNSRNSASVSQYDQACAKQPQ